MDQVDGDATVLGRLNQGYQENTSKARKEKREQEERQGFVIESHDAIYMSSMLASVLVLETGRLCDEEFVRILTRFIGQE